MVPSLVGETKVRNSLVAISTPKAATEQRFWGGGGGGGYIDGRDISDFGLDEKLVDLLIVPIFRHLWCAVFHDET